MGNSRSGVLQFRSERDRVSGFQGRQVDDADCREMLLIPLFGRRTESTEPQDTCTQDDQTDDGEHDEHEMVHGDAGLRQDWPPE